MIEKISSRSIASSFGKKINLNEKERIYFENYVDEFVKETKTNAPLLFGITSVWTILEYANSKDVLAKVLKRRLLGFFAPLLIGTSVLMAYIKTPKI